MRITTATLLLLLAIPSRGQSLDLTVGETGLSFGDSEEITGLRFNYRDRRLRRVTGINTTLWVPYEPAGGHVTGIAIGLPATGARDIEGIGLGVFGVGAEGSVSGIVLGGLGAGAGENLTGIAFGGLGVGAGGDVKGILFGGLGAGAGRDLVGFGIGGLGAGAGNDVTGVFIGGLGVGAGRNVTGLLIGGLGVGAGEDVTGVLISGLGAGAGRVLKGFSISGLGTGAGERLEGLHIAGLGVGAPEVRGIIVGLAAGGEDVVGGVLAPAYFKITENGSFRGVSISAYNRILGEQNGVTIGLLNFTHHLNGLQLGLLNYAGNKRRGLRWLPIANYHRD